MNLTLPGRGLTENSMKKKGDFFSCAPFVFFKWSHAVLSVIFGIFWEIWDRNRYSIFLSIIFSSKKIRQLLVGFFLGPNFSISPKTISMKKSMKIMNFEISKKFRNFEFSLTFSTTKNSDKNRKMLVPQKFPTNSFRIFFDDKFSDNCFSDYLFRSQISPRFQKSHLENCARRPGIQIPVIYDPAPLFSSIPNRSGSHLPYRLDRKPK